MSDHSSSDTIHRHPRRGPGILGLRNGRLAGAGPVPRRVAALLAPPLTLHRGLALATVAVLAVAAWSSAEAAHDLHLMVRSAGAA